MDAEPRPEVGALGFQSEYLHYILSVGPTDQGQVNSNLTAPSWSLWGDGEPSSHSLYSILPTNAYWAFSISHELLHVMVKGIEFGVRPQSFIYSL